jgi:signal transduction histidine kinase
MTSREDNREIASSLEGVARAEAETSQRARDELLSIASHELRTPCTSSMLGLQRLLLRVRCRGLQQVDPELPERAESRVR